MMNTNGDITIYHKDLKTDEYTPTQYRGVNIHHSKSITNSPKGISVDEVCKVRIPTDKNIDVSKEDYVFLGLTSEKIDKSNCLKVFGFADNRRGTLKHWRLELR